MSNKQSCSHLTRRGRPCRNPAVAGSDPPACAGHLGRPAPQASQPALPLFPATVPAPPRTRPGGHFYLPGPTADALRALEADTPAGDLQPEIDLVRVVLRELLAYLHETGEDLPPDELRRVSGLLFTGARTVALLLGKRPARSSDMDEWMIAALKEMSEQYGREL
ncbi:MAG: hypothetical protein KA170_01740 [Candidatus Promineofilum sp.]|nr:hypothetical protein [Promineifilum sp.]